MGERVHTGRRGGGADTRSLIQDAARRQFSELGYDRTSLRQVAQEAGVDPALVSHFFGTKEQLFRTVVGFPLNPSDGVAAVVAGPPDQAGLRLARFVLGALETESTRQRIIGLVRGAIAAPEAARLIREFLTLQLLVPVARHLHAGDAEYRASLVMSQIAGMILVRYIVAVEPLASCAPDEVAAALAPTLQRYLTGDIRG